MHGMRLVGLEVRDGAEVGDIGEIPTQLRQNVDAEIGRDVVAEVSRHVRNEAGKSPLRHVDLLGGGPALPFNQCDVADYGFRIRRAGRGCHGETAAHGPVLAAAIAPIRATADAAHARRRADETVIASLPQASIRS